MAQQPNRMGIRNYAKYFSDTMGVDKSTAYHTDTKRAVESFLYAMPRSKISDLSVDALDRWQTIEQRSGLSGAHIAKMRYRLLAIWAFAFEHGDNHNPPPQRAGHDYDWPTTPLIELQPAKEVDPPYRCEAGRGVVSINAIDHDLGEADSKASQLAYQRIIAEYKASGRAPHFGLPVGEMTVLELVGYYDCFARNYYGDGVRNEAANMRYAAKYLGLYHDLPAHQFGPLQLEAVRMRVQSARSTRQYCNSVVRRIQRVFRWAASQQLVPPETAHGLGSVAGWRKGRCPAKESRRIVPVPLEHVEATLPHLLPTVRAMVQFQLLTAARPGEVFKIRPCDVDRSCDVWVYTPTSHKSERFEKKREIYIGPKAQDVLRPFLLRPADAYCFSPKQGQAEGREKRSAVQGPRKTPRYPSEVKRVERDRELSRLRQRSRGPGEVYRANSYRNAIHRACLAAGVPEWFPYQLRHAAATEIRKKFGLESAQVFLGHSNAAVTEIYAEKNLDLGVCVAQAVG